MTRAKGGEREEGWVAPSYVAHVAHMRAMRAQKGAIADHASRGGLPALPPRGFFMGPGLRVRQQEVEARIRSEHPTWTEAMVDEAVALAMNRLGIYAPTSPGAGFAPRPAFPQRFASHGHLLVAVTPEAESGPQRNWRQLGSRADEAGEETYERSRRRAARDRRRRRKGGQRGA